jgi:hypothetical protein
MSMNLDDLSGVSIDDEERGILKSKGMKFIFNVLILLSTSLKI